MLCRSAHAQHRAMAPREHPPQHPRPRQTPHRIHKPTSTNNQPRTRTRDTNHRRKLTPRARHPHPAHARRPPSRQPVTHNPNRTTSSRQPPPRPTLTRHTPRRRDRRYPSHCHRPSPANPRASRDHRATGTTTTHDRSHQHRDRQRTPPASANTTTAHAQPRTPTHQRGPHPARHATRHCRRDRRDNAHRRRGHQQPPQQPAAPRTRAERPCQQRSQHDIAPHNTHRPQAHTAPHNRETNKACPSTRHGTRPQLDKHRATFRVNTPTPTVRQYTRNAPHNRHTTAPKESAAARPTRSATRPKRGPNPTRQATGRYSSTSTLAVRPTGRTARDRRARRRMAAAPTGSHSRKLPQPGSGRETPRGPAVATRNAVPSRCRRHPHPQSPVDSVRRAI
jgi:hypothetical protein